VSSLTAFNAIHLECHTKMVNNAKGRVKNDWEVAMKSNGDAECNNWVPVPHPSCHSDEFGAALRKYKEAASQISGARLTAINHILIDIKQLLKKLASNSFRDSKTTFYQNSKLLLVFANILKDS
jgi:hypothetical protein